jgi:organic hydroperoxide reductase OsmC/OhrA
LSVPKEFGGEGGPGTNPERLFAVGYAACFHTGLLSVAQGRKLLSASTEHRWNYRILRRLRELDANRISLEPEHSIV